VIILNCIGTVSGRIVLVNNVSISPIAVPISDNIKVCVMTLQKTNLFGVLKAQGFTNTYLAKMVLAQTFIFCLL
jgi:hypothetical protein